MSETIPRADRMLTEAMRRVGAGKSKGSFLVTPAGQGLATVWCHTTETAGCRSRASSSYLRIPDAHSSVTPALAIAMKTPLIISLLALALSAGGVVAMLTSTDSSAPREAETVSPVVPGPDAELLAEVKALRERLAELEMRPAPAPAQRAPVTDGFVTKEDLAVFREEVLAALDGSSLVSSIQVPEFKDTVADTLEEIRRDQALEKTNATYQNRVDTIDDRMVKLDERLGLSHQQSSRLREELLAQYEREADLTRRWHEGVDPELLGEEKGTIHQTHQDALSTILTPEQLERYRSFGWRGGGEGK